MAHTISSEVRQRLTTLVNPGIHLLIDEQQIPRTLEPQRIMRLSGWEAVLQYMNEHWQKPATLSCFQFELRSFGHLRAHHAHGQLQDKISAELVAHRLDQGIQLRKRISMIADTVAELREWLPATVAL